MARNKVFGGGKVKGLLQRVMKLGARSAQLSLFSPLCCRVRRIVDWKRKRKKNRLLPRCCMFKRRKREAAPLLILLSALLNYTEAVTPRVFLSRFIFEARGKKSRCGIGNWEEFPIPPPPLPSPHPRLNCKSSEFLRQTRGGRRRRSWDFSPPLIFHRRVKVTRRCRGNKMARSKK